MSRDCIFCRIVDGEIPSYTIYEDEDTCAFLDAYPLTRGHTLVIPKAHYGGLDEMPAEEATAVFEVLQEIAPAVKAAVDAPASTIALNDGVEAGQEVPHVHWHIIPRFADGHSRAIHALFDGADLSDEEFETIAADIRGDR